MSYIFTALLSSFLTILILGCALANGHVNYLTTAWTLIIVQAGIGGITFLYACHINNQGFWN